MSVLPPPGELTLSANRNAVIAFARVQPVRNQAGMALTQSWGRFIELFRICARRASLPGGDNCFANGSILSRTAPFQHVSGSAEGIGSNEEVRGRAA